MAHVPVQERTHMQWSKGLGQWCPVMGTVQVHCCKRDDRMGSHTGRVHTRGTGGLLSMPVE